MANKFMFKPGTLAIFFFMALTGLILFNWASGSVNEITGQTSQDQQDSLQCAGIDADFVSVDKNGSNVKVLFSLNRDLDSVAVSVRGDRNVTKNLEDVRTGVMRNVSADVGNLSNIYIKPGSCDQVFSYQ